MAKENFEYSQKAWPTEYKGIVFRSRLEATWACFFDQMSWQWDYEPIDLDGWAPDFMLKKDKEIFVEVKPITSIEQLSNREKYIRKNIPGTNLSNCLVVGLKPFIIPPDDKHYYPFERYVAMGWIYNSDIDGWDEACFKNKGIGNTSGTLYDLLAENEGDWKSFWPESEYIQAMDAWNTAKNITSFKAKSK